LLPGRGLSRPGRGAVSQAAEMNPPTWAKNATPPPFGWALNSPKFASISWHRNHTPWKIQAGIRTRKIGKMKVSTPRAGTEDEVGAQHGGDDAAGAPVPAPGHFARCRTAASSRCEPVQVNAAQWPQAGRPRLDQRVSESGVKSPEIPAQRHCASSGTAQGLFRRTAQGGRLSGNHGRSDAMSLITSNEPRPCVPHLVSSCPRRT
jgi:hypothetical protein